MTNIEQKDGQLKLTMFEKAKVKPDKIPSLITKYRGALVFKAENPPYFLYQKKGKSGKEKDNAVLEVVKMLLNDIKSLLD